MPKKKSETSPQDQAKRFDAEVQRLIDAGELNPTEADKRLERVVWALGLPPTADD